MTTTSFPAAGHVYEARFDGFAFHLKFDADGRTMRFTSAEAPDFDTAEAVTYSATLLRPQVYLVTWKEADGTTVTHVEDFERDTVYTNITQPDRTFLNLVGRWSRLG